ncbi:glycosyltransferase [Candidatus Berkiella aquae]|uniref:Chondroitin synthase n=1 Tax=Candidatus Berkiella aquae TaxID=295108 RepID=A0A0Q9YNQ6_9GAMM|nr:glycosyltransferase family A protein [Candidatus Berkiella aquae]MCS5712447.1 glycosyltransferase family 2 protein [Candidatus Berkiella aquae]
MTQSNLNIPKPRVSIIIATYNRKTFLQQAIASVFKQTYQDFELIIVDDGSTDDTASMVAEFNDPRLHYIYQGNHGRSYARNIALNLVKGEYIAFLDSDDLYLPHKLQLQVAYLDKHLKTGMIYTSAQCIDEHNHLLSHIYQATTSGHIYKKIAFFVPVTITLPTVMLRKEILLKVNGFDEKMVRFEDTDFWRRISKITRIDAIDNLTCQLRTHSDNHLLSQNPQQIVHSVHYYTRKILKEDKKYLSTFELYRRLGGLYHYYASALLSVPGWEPLGYKLLKRAYFYWPLYKISKRKIASYCWQYLKKRIIRFGLRHSKVS